MLAIEGTDLTLWGDWSGKDPDQWMDDVVQVRHRGGKVAKRLGEDVAAAEAVRAALG